MGLSFRSGGAWKGVNGLWYRSASAWKPVVRLWRYDADRPQDLDTDPPIEYPTGSGGVGVWVLVGTMSPPGTDPNELDYPSNLGQIGSRTFIGGSSYNQSVRAVWDNPGTDPYSVYGVDVEIQSCGDGGDIFTPDGNWVWWANAGAPRATDATSNTVVQSWSPSTNWVRCRARFTNEVGNGPWSPWSTPSRVYAGF